MPELKRIVCCIRRLPTLLKPGHGGQVQATRVAGQVQAALQKKMQLVEFKGFPNVALHIVLGNGSL